MQFHLVMTLFFVACLTVLLSRLSLTDAASTERPYQFGFTIEKQQHRQEKKDERGIVMGEFGFITADGIYHVTVYATDEEGKFRILAMRSYPYEEHPKTIDMIVRPKAKPPTTPKAIAPPLPITTTERAKPKPIEKHNFSGQGCAGCFLKNNAPTTTRKPEDKKYEIRPLSKPLSPEIGKQVVKKVLPQILQKTQKFEKKLEKNLENVTPHKVVVTEGHTDESYFLANTIPVKIIQDVEEAQATTQDTRVITQKINKITPSTQATTQKTFARTQNTKAIKSIQHNPPLSTQTQLKSTTTSFDTFSADTNQLSPSTVVLHKASPAAPGNAINSNTAKTPTTNSFGGASTPKAPPSGPSAGPTSATRDVTTPKKVLTAPAIPAGSTGGSVNHANTNTGLGGVSSSGGSGGLNSGGQSSSGGKKAKGGSFGGASGSDKPSETGDLYRFKYILDYNGHRETGSRNGNKEGNYYAIGDDNVERTIEYIANEFGYQPRVRFRKLDAPVRSKENTLKDYEFVWFKE